jgi:hypothetical protein
VCAPALDPRADNYVNETGTVAIAALLKSNACITAIDLSGESGGGAAARAGWVRDAWGGTDNAIGNAGATALAEALKFNATITRLDIHSKRERPCASGSAVDPAPRTPLLRSSRECARRQHHWRRGCRGARGGPHNFPYPHAIWHLLCV